MQIKSDTLDISTKVLAQFKHFYAKKITDWYVYVDGKKTDKKLGVKITVDAVNNDTRTYEILEVKLLNRSSAGLQIKDEVKFVNLSLQITECNYGVATVNASAEDYEIIPYIANEKSSIKLNINDGK